MPASPATDSTGGVPAPGPTDRVLVLAPHPDDESIGAGGLLLAARRAGAAVRVVFFTSGENNPWAQRAFERRLILTTRARMAFAGHREGEALAALAALGVEPRSVVFLRLPDQGLTHLLLRDPAGVCHRLVQELAGFAPTILVAPSAADLHPDHSAAAVLTQLALLSQGGMPPAPTALAFLVHNPGGRRRLPAGLAMPPADVVRKRAAILCHASQLIWRRGFLPSFATPREGYHP
ncbi:MAG: PIG-L family deacetylase, partial [Acidobacteriota bacterium]